MINLSFYLTLYIIEIILAVLVIIYIMTDTTPVLIIKNINTSEEKIFYKLSDIKKDVGVKSWEALEQFESKPIEIIKLSYPDYKIIKNTLLK